MYTRGTIYATEAPTPCKQVIVTYFFLSAAVLGLSRISRTPCRPMQGVGNNCLCIAIGVDGWPSSESKIYEVAESMASAVAWAYSGSLGWRPEWGPGAAKPLVRESWGRSPSPWAHNMLISEHPICALLVAFFFFPTGRTQQGLCPMDPTAKDDTKSTVTDEAELTWFRFSTATTA